MEMGIFSWIIVGLIAGFIATKMTGTRGGLIRDIVIGLVGSFVGGFIATRLQLPYVHDFWGHLVVATAGAVLFLVLWRLIRRA